MREESLPGQTRSPRSHRRDARGQARELCGQEGGGREVAVPPRSRVLRREEPHPGAGVAASWKPEEAGVKAEPGPQRGNVVF